MIVRPALAATVAAFAVAGSASAASLIINVEPTLASITVDVAACGEESETPAIPVTWDPERDCADPTPATFPEPAPSPSTSTVPQTAPQEPAGAGGTDSAATEPPASDAGPAEPPAPSDAPTGSDQLSDVQSDADPSVEETPSPSPSSVDVTETPDA
jgi:hypothetical protein